MAEVLLVAALVGCLTLMAVPTTASAIDAGRVRHAASFIASRFRLARHQAIETGQAVGLVFHQASGRWVFDLCVDGNDNGLHRQELLAGPDRCVNGPYDVSVLYPHVAITVDPAIRGPAGEPPSPDPVRFGSADLVSFSPAGTCTSGSLYLRSPRGVQYVVRLSGITGRLRVLRYDQPSRQWTEA